MGQFDSFSHTSDAPAVQAPNAGHIDFGRIIREGSAGAGSAAPPPELQAHPSQAPAYRQPVAEAPAVPAAPAPSRAPVYGSLSSGSASSFDDAHPPRPAASESVGNQIGNLFSGVAVLGSSAIAASMYAKNARKAEIADWLKLDSVTRPETLADLHAQTESVTGLVAEKSREASAAVDRIAIDKPHAFEEISEQMPAKGAGQPASQLVYKQVRNIGNLTEAEAAQLAEGKIAGLTEAELAIADRDVYLRSVERVLVSGFNMPANTHVSAFRQRQPNLTGLGASEAAEIEGIAAPLNKLEQTSLKLMAETTEGRVALHSSINSQIYKNMAVIGGSFVASRAIDHGIYGGSAQGFLTTAYDCAAPFLVFTKMSPLAKIGVMVGGHEVIRGIEYLTAKNKDKSE
jgi:hypothetical protein